MYSFSSRNCGIGRSIIFCRDSDASDPANMFLPCSNSARITPFEKISDRWSMTSKFACSGLMSSGVPESCSPSFYSINPAALATPKSVNFTSPSKLIMMLRGLTSRCTMPGDSPSSFFAVCVIQAAGDAARDKYRQQPRYLLALGIHLTDELGEIHATDEFHDHVVGSLIALQFDTALGTHPSIERLPLVPEIVNLHDLRMDQIRDKFPLADEVLDELPLHREALMHHLDRHFLGKPLGADLVGPKHRPHSSVGDLINLARTSNYLLFRTGLP